MLTIVHLCLQDLREGKLAQQHMFFLGKHIGTVIKTLMSPDPLQRRGGAKKSTA